MTNDTTNQTDSDNTDPTDNELAEIYRLALFSEEFQLLKKADLESLSPESIKQLKDADQRYIEDLDPPKEMTDRIWQNLQSSQASVESIAKRRKLFSSNKDKSKSSPRSFPFSMGFQVPMSLAAGLVLGVLFGVQFAAKKDLYIPGSYSQTRGVSTSIIEDIPDSLKSSPDKWLDVIAKLIKEGKVKEAQDQLRAFQSLYPNYQGPAIDSKN